LAVKGSNSWGPAGSGRMSWSNRTTAPPATKTWRLTLVDTVSHEALNGTPTAHRSTASGTPFGTEPPPYSPHAPKPPKIKPRMSSPATNWATEAGRVIGMFCELPPLDADTTVAERC